MISYAMMVPLKPEEWIRNKSWLTNRFLFLLNLKDKNNERFWGGDPEDIDEYINTRENSFNPEFEELMKKFPVQAHDAFGIWTMEWETNKISYVEMK